jgi:hypothetical protein
MLRQSPPQRRGVTRGAESIGREGGADHRADSKEYTMAGDATTARQ